jgi:hypothetical protein
MSFYSGIPSELLYALPAPVTKNTYTTQAVFSAPVTQAVAMVPANFFGGNPNGIGRTLRLTASGTIATTAAATFNFVLGWDPTVGTLGTTLATPWPTLAPTAATTCVWELDAVISASAVGSAGLTLNTNGRLKMSVVASGTLSTANQEILIGGALTTGLISTAQAAIEFWGTWSASAAGNTTTVQQYILAGLN